jgi:hypothetical protein
LLFDVRPIIAFETTARMPVFSKELTEMLDNSAQLISLSAQNYKKGELLIKPHMQSERIDAISVFRNKKQFLRVSLPKNAGSASSMWLGFPYVANNRKLVHTFDGDIEQFIPETAKLSASPFVDFDGDGIPDLIVCHDNGNAGNAYAVYSLGPKPKTLWKIDAWRSSAQFIDVDGDGKCEALARDTTFYGWKACNACSPMPLVVLKAVKSRLEMAPSLMKAKSPAKEQQRKMLADWVTACRTGETPGENSRFAQKGKLRVFALSPVVWGDMLHMMYSGNSKLAFSMLDQFWPSDAYTDSMEMGCTCSPVYTSKGRFVSMFLSQLRYSPYLEGLKKLNQGDSHLAKLKKKPMPIN